MVEERYNRLFTAVISSAAAQPSTTRVSRWTRRYPARSWPSPISLAFSTPVDFGFLASFSLRGPKRAGPTQACLGGDEAWGAQVPSYTPLPCSRKPCQNAKLAGRACLSVWACAHGRLSVDVSFVLVSRAHTSPASLYSTGVAPTCRHHVGRRPKMFGRPPAFVRFTGTAARACASSWPE